MNNIQILFKSRDKLKKWIIVLGWIGTFSLFSFAGLYMLFCQEEIENDYRNLHNVAMAIELPEASYHVKYERRKKFLYSMQYIEFMDDEPSLDVIDSIEKSLSAKGFKRIPDKTHLATFVKDDYVVSLYLGKDNGKYYINISQENWKWRLGI